MTIAIIIHGGASEVPAEKAEAFRQGCRAALDAGWSILEAGGDACSAVVAAIRVMEADPAFNAAYGGALNADGVVCADAAIMEGKDLRFGALAAVQGLRHPISVARQVLDVGPLLLSGEGAVRFAAGRDAELCEPEDLITADQRQKWEETERQLKARQDTKHGPSDTVGCVALDASGLIAVGSSTGGEDHNPPGRVGDTAQIGCGVYADNTLGGCAVTGTGEAIMQVVLAKTVVELLAAGLDPDTAAQQGIDLLGERVQGEGGCIVLDKRGRVGWAHNSEDMPCAYRTSAMDAPFLALRRE